MRINKVYCLFEQSGTFKKAFQELGISAEDYDILDDFGETDHITDLFSEIEKAYAGETSIFDEIGETDLVLAFFPCTRFEAKVPLSFRGERNGMQKMTDVQKLEYSMKLHEELHKMFILICKLFVIANRRGMRMIVENPYTQPHYLTAYFPIKPQIIDNDRRTNGDYYKKPTQFWFVNCKPEQNMFFEPIEAVQTHTVASAEKMDGNLSRQVKRSLMHPQYAKRFIKSYIMDTENEVEDERGSSSTGPGQRRC